MRILHTGDWHLGDRLGRIDRTDDLRRAVERIGDFCRFEKVEVLLIAGDLFSELARPDGLRESIRHLQETFGAFFHGGGTILAVTGNHDNENFCQTLWHAMSLAAPAVAPDGRALPGRLHLATQPTLLRLAGVPFLMMPYPTPVRYLHEQAQQRYGSLEEKNRLLLAGFSAKLAGLQADPAFDAGKPAVLCAHLSVMGCELSNRFRISDEEDLVLPDGAIPARFAYVALGHIHKPQHLGGKEHVRYSGSIERLDLGEKNDQKSVVLLEVGPNGLTAPPTLLPLDATPIYELDVRRPAEELPELAARFADAKRDLVNLHITYTAGVDNLEEVLSALEKIFPRWYARDWKESEALGEALTIGPADRAKGFAETVRDYVTQELTNHPDADRAAILDRLEELLKEAV